MKARRQRAGQRFVVRSQLQTSNSDALQLVDEGRCTPDLIFKSAAWQGEHGPAQTGASEGDRRTLLWSRDFEPVGSNPSDLKQQIAYTAGRCCNARAKR